eukprot:GHVL01042822.1.p1 GENE.GHVL01042822.1~~GHVL01042822.1.p1  ORF type:complete len:199 (+),score=33.76 GHVL01042822.1:31-597(+)
MVSGVFVLSPPAEVVRMSELPSCLQDTLDLTKKLSKIPSLSMENVNISLRGHDILTVIDETSFQKALCRLGCEKIHLIVKLDECVYQTVKGPALPTPLEEVQKIEELEKSSKQNIEASPSQSRKRNCKCGRESHLLEGQNVYNGHDCCCDSCGAEIAADDLVWHCAACDDKLNIHAHGFDECLKCAPQ